MPEDRWEQAIANRSALKAFLLGAGFPPLGDAQVRSVTVPTLLVTGADSPAFFLRLTDRLEELLPRAERVEIENSAHLVHHHNPEALNKAIASFI